MLKKIIVVCLILTLTGCAFVFDSLRTGGVGSDKKVIVAVLLPITPDRYKATSEQILTAIHYAYDQSGNDSIVLKIYDTKGTEEGAQKAYQKAIKDKAVAIIGPLLSVETKALPHSSSIPIFTFSNDIDVLENKHVYIVSFFPMLEIEKAIDYAVKHRKSRTFAIIAPDNRYGQLIAETATASINARGLTVANTILYPPNKANLTKELSGLISPSERRRIANIRSDLQKGKEVLDRRGRVITKTPYPHLDFDTLIIGDFGQRMMIVASHLPALDITTRSITILGNNNWNIKEIGRENTLQGAYVPRYEDLEKTNLAQYYAKVDLSVTGLLEFAAFDAMMIISNLIYKDKDNTLVVGNIEEFIKEYQASNSALNGNIRMRDDRIVERSMYISTITRENERVVDTSKDLDYSVVRNYSK